MSVVIEHTAAEGTLVVGTSRGDGSAEVLKGLGWRWGRSIGLWFVPRSRDRRPNRELIERTAGALRAGGFEVEVRVDATPRATAEVETDQVARAEARSEALSAKAGQLQARADEALRQARGMAAQIPTGQPILVGHHSEGRERRFRERMTSTYDKAFELRRAAFETRRRAEAAGARTTTGAGRHPEYVGDKIEALAADLRRAERHGRAEDVEHLVEKLGYWRQIRADQVASGQVVDHGPHTIAAGDLVLVRGTWYPVIRASAKSVTVKSEFGHNRVPYHGLRDHHRPTDTMRVAGAFLVSRGWVILDLAHTWRGEDDVVLDLIARDPNCHVVGVLIRSAEHGDPLETIRQDNVDAAHQAVAAWASTQPASSTVRVDALGLIGQPGKFRTINHVHEL